jgi:LDH2 family malate/lactate/ureidoglycolate dehydrogenase
VDIQKHISKSQLDALIDETLAYNLAQNENARYPGQQSLNNRKYHMEHGVEIPKEVWDEVTNL